MHRYKKTAAMLCAFFAAILFFLTLHHFTGTICLFNSVFGIPCPGCGLTRAAVFALQGRFTESLAMHPLLFPALAVLAYMIINNIILKKKPSKLFYFIITLCLIVFLGFYIWRMMTCFPNIPPMTYNSHSLFHQIIQQ